MDLTLSVNQTASFLSISGRRVRFMLATGQIRAEKNDSGYWRIPMTEVERILMLRAHSVKKIAKATGFHPETIRKWLRLGRIKGQKNGLWVIAENIYSPVKPPRKRRKAPPQSL